MKTQMYYCMNYSQQIAEILDKYSHPYISDENLHQLFGKPMLQFYIHKEDAAWSEIEDLVPDKYVHRLVFTDQELSSAKWLMVRSTNMKIDSLGENTFSYLCPAKVDPPFLTKYHMTQVGPFEFRPVKWKKNNHFYSTYEWALKL